MSQIVVDTDVASYIFNWHSLAQHYADALRGSELVYADNDLCTVWARIRADARAAGRALSPRDAWIAATALALGAPLATNNRRDFEHVRKLRLLPL